jgi:hypothetical protein
MMELNRLPLPWQLGQLVAQVEHLFQLGQQEELVEHLFQ